MSDDAELSSNFYLFILQIKIIGVNCKCYQSNFNNMREADFFSLLAKNNNATVIKVLWILVLFHIKLTFQDDEISFTILHTGKLCGHVEEMRKYGGMPRIISFVKSEKAKDKSTLFFDTGDSFTGSLWFWALGADIIIPFYKLLEPTAICFGEHEMDKDAVQLKKFIKEVGSPFLCCNCDMSREPMLAPLVIPRTKITVDNTEVGIIGYLTDKAHQMSNKFANITVKPRIPCINEQVKKFQDENVTIIILLGHGRLEQNIILARELDGIDIIVGGHSQELLYTGKLPKVLKRAKLAGEYPLIVKNKKGVDVPIIIGYKYGYIVGKLSVQFSKDGQLLKSSGNSILMDSAVEQDKDALAVLKKYAPKLEQYKNKVLGTSRVDLDAECREKECNVGNLVTDSWVDYIASQYKHNYWTDTPVAIVNGGAFTKGIQWNGTHKDITLGNIIDTSPYNDFLRIVEIDGALFKKFVEFSIRDDYMGASRFLQYSGVRVKMYFDKDNHKQIQEIKVRCGDCEIPRYEELRDTKVYKIIMSDYLCNGGAGYTMFKNESRSIQELSMMSNDALVQYIEYYKVITPETNERILISTPTNKISTTSNGSKLSAPTKFKILLAAAALARSYF